MLADLVFPTSVAMLLVGELANSLLYLFGTMMVAPFSVDTLVSNSSTVIVGIYVLPAVHTGLSVVCTNTCVGVSFV